LQAFGTASNYSVEYTTGLSLPAGDPASPLRWNTAPAPLDSFPGNGQSTTVSGNVTTLLIPGGQLPDLSKAFFRLHLIVQAHAETRTQKHA
jgi:hypothetical protein